MCDRWKQKPRDLGIGSSMGKARMGLGMGCMHHHSAGQMAENFKFIPDHGDTVFVVHFSDGRVRYTLNKNNLKIEIPLPFGGKSSKDLKMVETIRTPVINLQFVGLHLPSRELQVPTFTIPTVYELRVPHLGVLDLSTNVYSNLYNWSASYTGGNTSTDHLSLQARYRMKADSVVDLLSYSVQGEPCLGRECTGLSYGRL